VDNCATNANCTILWSNLELMQVAPPVGQIWNQFWWHHLVVKFWTNTSGTTYNWPNLEPMQVAFYLAGEITQVIDSIPWVRCASCNVWHVISYSGAKHLKLRSKIYMSYQHLQFHCPLMNRVAGKVVQLGIDPNLRRNRDWQEHSRPKLLKTDFNK